MALKISNVYPEYVFQRLGAGKTVCAVDFKRKTYIDLEGQTVAGVQKCNFIRSNRKNHKRANKARFFVGG